MGDAHLLQKPLNFANSPPTLCMGTYKRRHTGGVKRLLQGMTHVGDSSVGTSLQTNYILSVDASENGLAGALFMGNMLYVASRLRLDAPCTRVARTTAVAGLGISL